MEQLVALGIESGDQDSTAKSLVALKNELAEEKLAREKAQTNVETVSWAVEDLKKMADQFTTQIPSLETQVKNQNDKITDLNVKLRARELCLERTTTAKDDFQHQSTQLSKKLRVNTPPLYHLSLIPLLGHC
jgi:chromosome segregation ATPase